MFGPMEKMRWRLTIGILGSAALLPLTAAAEVATVIDIDPGQVIGVTLTAVDAGDSLNAIVSILDATATSSVDTNDGNSIATAIVGGPELVLDSSIADSEIFAVGRGNIDASFIGLFPDAPAGAGSAGAAIFQGLVLRDSSLFATTVDNAVSLSVETGDASLVVAEIAGTEIEADAIYNGSVGSIEALPTASLRTPDEPANYTDLGTDLVELQASVSVAATQINSAFLAAPDQPQVPAATAVAGGNSVELALTGSAGSFLSGSATLTDNRIRARAASNYNDGSILLRDEIATADGIQNGPGYFDGTALVYAFQNTDDVVDGDDEDFLGQGIVALTQENSISGNVDAGTGGQGAATLDSQVLNLVGNAIEATATINQNRSEIGADADLALIGTDSVLDQGAGEASVLLQERLGLRDALADYVIASRQSANRREEVDSVAYALALDNSIDGGLSTPATVASLAVNDNGISAIVAGNRNDSLLHNRLDAVFEDRAPFVDATMAALNWQWITAPEIVATVSGSGAAVTAFATLLSPGDDQSGALELNGNDLLARADGNRATSELAFAAIDLNLALATDGPAGAVDNAGAALFSDRGATNDGDTFGATAGGVITSYQIIDSAAESHAESDYQTAGVRAEVLEAGIFGSLTVDGTRAAGEGLVLALESLGNRIEGRAQGNAFTGQAAYRADGLFTGSLGILGVQIDNDQSVSTTVLDSDVVLALDATAVDASPFAASVSLGGNSLLAVSGVNVATHSLSLQATRLAAAGQNSLYDAGDPSTALGGLIEGYQFASFRVTRHTSFANAAFAILNDQTVDEADSQAFLFDSDVRAEVTADPALRLENVAIELFQSTLVAQARLNGAENRIVIDIATLAEIDPDETPGPLAGIVSFQGSGHGDPDNPEDFDLGPRLSVVEAILQDSAVEVTIPALLHGSVAVTQNLLVATAAADVAANSIDISAVSLQVGLEESGYVAILDNQDVNPTDFDIEVLGSVFIANSQRNEWQLFGGGPGPSVVAYQGGEAGIRVISSGELDQGLLTITNNAIVSEARATVAQNVITLSAVTIEASGQIVSRQGNSGDVTATVENAPILAELNAGPGLDASEASVVTITDNAIESLALGNAVLNAITATADSQFLNTDGEAPVVNEELPATSGETTVETDYAILNRQVNAGSEERPMEINSTVEDSEIVVNLNGNHDATHVEVSNNGISASAYGNIATNSINLQAGGGSMPGSSIVNQQSNSFANVTATVSGSGVSVNMNGVGPGATLSTGNNGLSATAIGNSATNTMVSRSGGPGPVN